MIIHGGSYTECWLKLLTTMANDGEWSLSPVIANYATNLAYPPYKEELEHEINEYLKGESQSPIETTASTIFPISLMGGQESIFDRFDKVWKYIKKDSRNYKGHYFRRLMAFNEKHGEPINQLKHIIETYNGIEGVRKPIHRRSALIALTFDPSEDHSPQPLRGFPCLQQVCLIPKKNGKMTLNAIYAMQHLVDRGYGNYLGLKNLGDFMAGEMGLELDEVNCIASILELGKIRKSEAKKLVEKYS